MIKSLDMRSFKERKKQKTIRFAAGISAAVFLCLLASFFITRAISSGKDDHESPVKIEKIEELKKEEPSQNTKTTHKDEPPIKGTSASDNINNPAEDKLLSDDDKSDPEDQEIADQHEEKSSLEDDKEKTEETPQQTEQRILFIGDSRTIDMFADSDETISGAMHDGITVYAKHGYGFDFMKESVNNFGLENFDVLVCWMGANDHGIFDSYANYYSSLLDNGKTIILCTVGPTDDEHLVSYDHPNYENAMMQKYNESLLSYAKEKGIKVIDLYAYISNNVSIDPADGIHYTPRPTTSIWKYILSSI